MNLLKAFLKMLFGVEEEHEVQRVPERRSLRDAGPFPDPFWTMFVPVITTGHITEEANNDLQERCQEPLATREDYIIGMPYGFLIFVGSSSENWENYPTSVQRLCEWAYSHKYEWLRLDADGDEIPNFPVYEW